MILVVERNNKIQRIMYPEKFKPNTSFTYKNEEYKIYYIKDDKRNRYIT